MNFSLAANFLLFPIEYLEYQPQFEGIIIFMKMYHSKEETGWYEVFKDCKDSVRYFIEEWIRLIFI